MKKRLTFIALVICFVMVIIPLFSNMAVSATNVEITVRTLSGKDIPITIDNSETFLALKTKITEDKNSGKRGYTAGSAKVCLCRKRT